MESTMIKHSKLFGFITILGIVFVATFIAILYSYYYLFQPFPFEPSVCLRDSFAGFLLFGGPVLLIVGILGIGRQRFRNHRRLFTILTVVLVPLSVFILIFQVSFFAPLIPGGIDPYERMTVTQVSVESATPLTLAVSVQSMYSQDITIVAATVEDNNQTKLAYIEGKWNPPDSEGMIHGFNALCDLPAGSEKTFALNFNTTLSSGNYCVGLITRHSVYYSPYFTIP
jgi:hypothetical protein